MKALISPNEKRDNGYRVAQVAEDDQTFDVAPPMFWMDCAFNVLADQWYFDTTERKIKLIEFKESDEFIPPDPRNPFVGKKGPSSLPQSE